MSRPQFTVSSTRFSDSEDDDDALLPRTDSMRYDSMPLPGNDNAPTPQSATFWYRTLGHTLRIQNTQQRTFVLWKRGFAFDEGHPVDPGPRAARESDRPLNMWAQYDRETFLDELVRCEGRGDYFGQKRCAECRGWGTQKHRCEECFTGALFCTPCLISIHADNPFHFVQTWNGTFFERNTLRSLGLRIQLGHARGEACPGTLARAPEERANTDKNSFCVVHTNGIHEVALDFCSCGKAQSHAVQLLRARLYPATTLRPSSAASFNVLRKFHMHSFESKCSAYEFYNALARETNNTGDFQPRDRYREFLRMTREWRNLQMLKRSGRAHIPDGVKDIEAGACALLCPACPQPGKNLPPDGDWKSVPFVKRFLYALFLAIDANFRMKRKQVSSEDADPGLNNGAAFFSEVHTYMEHVREHWDFEQEKSRCVSHDAVNQPDRDSRGTASSGIGTVDCARHNMKRPNGVGDLQKGERYINMDYMLWKSLQGYDDLIQLIVSYDIVCQWSINIWRRLARYKPELKDRAGTGYRYWVWLIPKFHLPAHIEACNILYSFDLSPYVAQTDGEAPERGWANANPLAASTREMGPGARHDILDDHFNDWNHKKIVALGRVMLERIQKAVGQMMEKQEDLVETEASLPPENVKAWTAVVELWEFKPSNPNPFDVKEKHATLQAVRKRIAEGMQDAVEGDRTDDVRGDLHVSEMLAMGMQLESQQRDLASDSAALKTHASDAQKTTLLERGNKLRRKIASWVRTQTEFQLEVARLRERDDLARAESAKTQPTAGVSVEAIELWLPSKQAKTPGVVVKQSHARYEFDMREARAYEALEEIRRLLLVRTHHYKFKDKNVSGVSGHTRSRQTIAVLDERIRREASEYRAARHALACLAPRLGETRWSLVLKELAPKDIRGMPRALFSDPARKRQKKRQRQEQQEREPVEMSWIWRTGLTSLAAAASTSEEAAVKATNEGLRVEWAKTRARAHRWTEEVDLLEEEMRRILVFLQWKADWWRGQKNRRSVDEVEAKEGFSAYAERQAAIQETMKVRFTDDWKDVGRWIALGRQGVADFKERGPVAEEGESDDEEVPTDDESYEPVPLLPQAGATALVEASLLSVA
ncbi:hypothetical protein MSAN_00584800 [Mycena sanguinolenta]|uniref:CxC2-like cysteine cluster KDZ transposase-associated domain-containing protein n=1 Tax=Mycena sanguinolenta TaxID=230812 RepID=A0A8H7DHU8_9AGAR|nr:hypothetical protein MSAN_00584800 [Mycena sanguinolenta]